jgi:hypothetical protein
MRISKNQLKEFVLSLTPVRALLVAVVLVGGLVGGPIVMERYASLSSKARSESP